MPAPTTSASHLARAFEEKCRELDALHLLYEEVQKKLVDLREVLDFERLAHSGLPLPHVAPSLPVKETATTAVQTDLPTPTVAKPSLPKSFAQVAKTKAPQPPAPAVSAKTSDNAPLPAGDTRVDNATGSSFKGRRATKPNELHIQLQSRAAFNSKLLKYTFLKINHRHALLDAFVNAVSTKINKKTHAFFLDNRINSAFWSPRGNLIIRTKRAPSVQLQTLLLDTVEMLCGGRKFVVLSRPTLSLLKLHNIPTCNSDGSAVDLDLLTAELFQDARITKASFWHLPRFVSFKGTPLGRKATVFFSLVDTPQYALGHSLINSTVSISDIDYEVHRWIPATRNPNDLIPLGRSAFYKERDHRPPPSDAERVIKLHRPRTDVLTARNEMAAALAAYHALSQRG
ncbi:hypothetical protein AX14_013651 [Amanita brunnescens Koide BX004]|nr:hypothetical protein AX14_013651 [Amanita brunnescens Koide BX004]